MFRFDSDDEIPSKSAMLKAARQSEQIAKNIERLGDTEAANSARARAKKWRDTAKAQR